MEINRDFSFRGRKYLGFAFWKKKGIKNVITFYLNKIDDNVKEIGHSNYDDLFLLLFIALDFHEFLHLFIRRESGLKNTWRVTEETEAFIESAENKLIDLLKYDILYFPEVKNMSLSLRNRPIISDITIGDGWIRAKGQFDQPIFICPRCGRTLFNQMISDGNKWYCMNISCEKYYQGINIMLTGGSTNAKEKTG